MQTGDPVTRLTLRDLFTIFVKAGLAFGGGLGILAVMQDELVERRRALEREEFLAIYGLGRIVPSGTMTALAVAFGYKLGGYLGTLVAIVGLALPAFVLTVLLTAAYTFLRDGPFFALVPVTILPAALAFIVAAALRLGRDVFTPSFDLALAVGAFLGAFVFDLPPALLLVVGGIAGIIATQVLETSS